ncbi:serine protease [Burkholderia pyrrocinia]|uniref:Probable periplasmic serine endoprotease DegP-like n=2 Tax=Burkholderia pyrrocinia TaxID=60550 RepID=A0A2Z5N7Q0_BURPY|nr:serine protease [Burkholderia pyrrocinia]
MARTQGPAVVSISISSSSGTSDLKQLWPPRGPEDNPFLRYFQQFPPSHTDVEGKLAAQHASGFIITADGDILTNASNIVAHASKISVTLADGRTYRAKVIGSDPASGVALLKIPENGLPVAKIGSASTVKAGEWVASIGSPYGLGNSIERGIVSNTSRLLPDQSYVPLIQTDLTENAGDAGSPLLNLKGEVIGIETPPPDNGNTYQGLAFAIPIDEAMKVERQLKLHGKAEHGRMGISVQEVTGPLALSFGLPKPNGALVTSVDAGSPAAKAGLRAGDIIVGVNGAAVPDSIRLPVTVADMRPGTAIELSYWRAHAMHHTALTLAAVNTNDASVVARSQGSADTYGLTVRNLTRDERRTTGIQGGVRVEQSSGSAAFAGIEPGDIILKVDNTSVSSTAQFLEQIAHAKQAVALLVERHGTRMFVTMEAS